MDRLRASFRDPSGHLYVRDGLLLRHVSQPYQPVLDRVWQSGLYDELVDAGLAVPVQRLDAETLQPERIAFISYPYEWCFAQYRDAALLTLDLAERALAAGFVLKDASAYNVQFHHGRPVLIDTLSFDDYREGAPWIAYGQFCRHFLAPLALMSLVDARLNSLMRVHIDGVPLDLASRILPGTTRLRPGLAAHIHLHGKAQNRPAEETKVTAKVSRTAFAALLDSLKGTIIGLREPHAATEWGDYYAQTNYSSESGDAKANLVADFIRTADPKTCWDLGANTGEYSRLAAEHGAMTVAWDIDPQAVSQAYGAVKAKKETRLLPLLVDLSNPSPDLGWANEERDSLAHRGPADLVMALALVHHLAIGNNVPLPMIADYLARLGRSLIIEFVPKEDSQVRRMLGNRTDVFDDYHSEGFEQAFRASFDIARREPIPGTERTLYLMHRR